MKNIILGFVLTVFLGFTGLVYGNVTHRLDALEQDRKDLQQVAFAIDKQTAVMEATVRGLTTEVGTLRVSQTETTKKVNDISLLLQQNTRDYREALRLWREALDKIANRKDK